MEAKDMAKKDIQTKLTGAKQNLDAVKAATGTDADKKAAAKLRDAKKKVRRAQRKLMLEKAVNAKREAQEANRAKKAATASEKAAKKEAAKDSALTAAAETPAE